MTELKLALQLYTCRDILTNEHELRQNFIEFNKMGYEAVEISGLSYFPPSLYRDALANARLTASSMSFTLTDLRDNIKGCIADLKAVGTSNAVCHWMHEDLYSFDSAGFRAFAKDMRKVVKQLADEGMTFSYHLHSHEFRRVDGLKRGIDIILQDCPNLMIEADSFWLQQAGVDVRQYIEDLKGRIALIHFKDIAIEGYFSSGIMTEVGRGNMNFKGIIDSCVKAGVEYIIVEQDDHWTISPYESAKFSANYLRKLMLR